MVDLSLFVRENNHPECIPSHRYLAPHPLGRVTYHASHEEAVKAIAAAVKRDKLGEYCVIEQTSTFERLFGRKPARFRLRPFKDENTASIGEKQGG